MFLLNHSNMFAVIKYNERFALKVPGIQDTFPRWAKVVAANVKLPGRTFLRARIKPITRDCAQELIEENGLVETLRTRDGVVFDTPDHAFQKKYAGILDIPRNLGSE